MAKNTRIVTQLVGALNLYNYAGGVISNFAVEGNSIVTVFDFGQQCTKRQAEDLITKHFQEIRTSALERHFGNSAKGKRYFNLNDFPFSAKKVRMEQMPGYKGIFKFQVPITSAVQTNLERYSATRIRAAVSDELCTQLPSIDLSYMACHALVEHKQSIFDRYLYKVSFNGPKKTVMRNEYERAIKSVMQPHADRFQEFWQIGNNCISLCEVRDAQFLEAVITEEREAFAYSLSSRDYRTTDILTKAISNLIFDRTGIRISGLYPQDSGGKDNFRCVLLTKENGKTRSINKEEAQKIFEEFPKCVSLQAQLINHNHNGAYSLSCKGIASFILEVEESSIIKKEGDHYTLELNPARMKHASRHTVEIPKSPLKKEESTNQLRSRYCPMEKPKGFPGGMQRTKSMIRIPDTNKENEMPRQHQSVSGRSR